MGRPLFVSLLFALPCAPPKSGSQRGCAPWRRVQPIFCKNPRRKPNPVAANPLLSWCVPLSLGFKCAVLQLAHKVKPRL